MVLNGGSAPFTFNWYDLNMSALTSSSTLNFSDSLSNLQAGDYILQVIDDNNCVLIDTINMISVKNAISVIVHLFMNFQIHNS